jgi:hypothetical protein
MLESARYHNLSVLPPVRYDFTKRFNVNWEIRAK